MKGYLRNARNMVLGASLVCAGGTSHAGILSLAETPLFLTNAVEPNVFFLLDDSGSMEWEVLLQGAGASGLGSGINTGYYVLPSPNNGRDQYYITNYGNYFPYTINDEDTITGLGVWRLKNSSFNQLYYDPTLTYEPWAGTSGGSPIYANSPPSAALADPTDASVGTLDLTSSITFNNYRFDTSTWYSETIFPATYYTWTDTNADGVVDATDAHTRVRIEPSVTTYSDCASAPVCTYAEEIQNFANWYTYYRKRNYIARGAIGAVIDDSNAVRSGLYVYNNNLRQSILSLSNTTNKETLLNSLYSTVFRCDNSCPGTPARSAMTELGEYFKDSTNTPILPANAGGACQQNFNIVVTDGYWNGGLTAAQAGIIGNDDGDGDTVFDGGDYADAQAETLADIAMYYYEKDLLTSIPDQVPTIPSIDPAVHQHLVTYSVAFGVVGTLDPFDTLTPGVASDTDPSDAAFAWPTITSNTDTTVDDLWHAAYNGRGQFLSAKNPEQLTTSLGTVIQNISDRTSSSSSVALSSGFLNSGSLLFSGTRVAS